MERGFEPNENGCQTEKTRSGEILLHVDGRNILIKGQ